MSDAGQDIFQLEAREHLQQIERSLLELERDPSQRDELDALFRSMHTIKGSGGMMGYQHLADFSHHFESVLDKARKGTVKFTESLASVLLLASDHINHLLDDPQPSADIRQHSDKLLAELNRLVGDSSHSHACDDSDTEHPTARLWHIGIKPSESSFRDGFDCVPVLRELASLGHLSVTRTLTAPEHGFDAESCYLQFVCVLSAETTEAAIRDAFIFVADDWQIDISAAAPESASEVAAPSAGQSELPQSSSTRKTKKVEDQLIRVPSTKLDYLMSLVGELVIVKARLEQLASQSHDEHLTEVSEELTRLSLELRDNAFDIRMLPIGSIFGRFQRLVRDLSKSLGKQVEFITEGEETELDKVVLDKLSDPLIHLIRNSLDHGLETPQQRLSAGKPEAGTIKLKASHLNGQILLEVSDDGAGINTQRVLEKARANGLLSEGNELTNEQIYGLIFEPGFSTAATVSDVSGRGVGMDVVKRSIESLQGRLSVHSESGQGTTIRILLPMTLAIIEGLMVKVSDSQFVIPLVAVEECIETSSTQDSGQDGARLVEYRERLTPCLRLRDTFAIAGARPKYEQTIVIKTDDKPFGITVDEVVGQYQTVIKNLGPLYQMTPGVMGATITGDGGVAMILDVNQLAEDARPMQFEA
ncbi:CheA signal transduction histidine kinase [Idiomarina fontislapidosi]|uniref:Chemotaxis protein CheA n=1 Tax=Idiomarina fontislapidosi TaxID=263723 RepID=A0A432YAW5_9GAMM|nr:chemotaxis protein CheA [Idiomarina fontislapidosi]PYE35178.1 CheA signal transduction histidine kinase [Idiomarina fontislapidosi]RUO58073.1 chemotaxis protein CheA [Idiomarina fontislapidosi]